MPKSTESTKRSPALKILLVTLGVAAVGGGIFWAVSRSKPDSGDLLRSDFNANPDPALPAPSTTTTTTTSSGSASKWRGQTFPLGLWSNGSRVSNVQRFLNAFFGESLKVDGYWGNLTQAAIERAHGKNAALLPSTVISEAVYNSILSRVTAGSGSTVNATGTALDAGQAARDLRDAVNAGNFNAALAVLQKMHTTSDYSNVSSLFRTFSTYGGDGYARRTVVNALVGDSMPWTFGQKSTFSGELLRMGLRHDPASDTWALSGIGPVDRGFPVVVAVRDTATYDGVNLLDEVSAGKVIGTHVGTKAGIVQVLTSEGRSVYVPETDVALR